MGQTAEQDRIAPAESADTSPLALLLARFSNGVDQKKPRVIGALFANGAVFQPADQPIVGPEAVETFYAARLTDERRRTRHVWSNLMVRPLPDGRAEFEAILTNYAFEPTVSEETLQVRVGNVWGVCTGGEPTEWRFETHFYQRVYAAAMPLTAEPLPLKKD
jgi:hypothetical protein